MTSYGMTTSIRFMYDRMVIRLNCFYLLQRGKVGAQLWSLFDTVKRFVRNIMHEKIGFNIAFNQFIWCLISKKILNVSIKFEALIIDILDRLLWEKFYKNIRVGLSHHKNTLDWFNFISSNISLRSFEKQMNHLFSMSYISPQSLCSKVIEKWSSGSKYKFMCRNIKYLKGFKEMYRFKYNWHS